MRAAIRKRYSKLFEKNLVSGFAWAIGVTIGFAFISSVLVILLSYAGGLPLVGNWIANVVEVTQSSLLKRTPIIRQ